MDSDPALQERKVQMGAKGFIGDLLISTRLQTAALRSDVAEVKANMRAMKEDMARAKDSVDLLSDAIGVRLPKELKKVISETKLVAPALSAAFKASAILAAGTVISDSFIPKVREATKWLGGLADEVRELEEETKSANREILTSFKNVLQGREFLDQQNKAIREAELKRSIGQAQAGGNGTFAGNLPGADVLNLGWKIWGNRQSAAADKELTALQKTRQGILAQITKLTEEQNKQSASIAMNTQTTTESLKEQAKVMIDLTKNTGRPDTPLDVRANPVTVLPPWLAKDVNRDAIIATIEAHRKATLDSDEQLRRAAESVSESVKTQNEKYQEQIALLDQLKNAGKITQETYDRAKKAADDSLTQTNNKLKEARSLWVDVGSEIMDQVKAAALFGRSWGDVLKAMIIDIGEMVIKWKLLKQVQGDDAEDSGSSSGGIAGAILGGIFGGFKAQGGPVLPGRSYIVGEYGPERVTFGAAGYVSPSGSSGAVQIVQHIDLRGADPSMKSWITQQLDRVKRETVAAAVVANRELGLRTA